MKQRDANGLELLGEFTEEQVQEYYKLLSQVLLLSVIVNNETDFCVFFDYYGHTGSVIIRIAESKANYTKELILSEFEGYWSKHFEHEKHVSWKIKDLQKKKEFMKYILDFCEIPYEQATSEIIEWTEEVWNF